MHDDDSLKAALWRLVRPIQEELVILACIVVGVFAIAAYQLSVGGSIGSESKEAVMSLGDIIRQGIQAFDDASLAAKLLLFGFWFLVGTVLYFVVWFCISLLIDVYNDVVISAAFVHPRSFHQSQYWAAIVGRAAVRALAGLALVVFSFVALRVVGVGYVDAAKALIETPSSTTVITVLASTLIAAISIHIGLILYKIAFLKITTGSTISS